MRRSPSWSYDSEVNRDRHENGWHTGPGTAGERSTITLGDKTWKFGDGFPGVRGTIHSMLAADGKLFVVTREGELYAFGGSRVEAKTHALADLASSRSRTPRRRPPSRSCWQRNNAMATPWSAAWKTDGWSKNSCVSRV